MSTYYINPNNKTGIIQYRNNRNGSPNFNTLLNNIVLQNNDVIRVVKTSPSTIVDDTMDTININRSVRIECIRIIAGGFDKVVDENVTVNVINSDVGFNIESDNVSVRNLTFSKSSNIGDNPIIYASGVDNIVIRRCNANDYIRIEESNFATIGDCNISSGNIQIIDSDKVDIYNNVITPCDEVIGIYCESNDNNFGINIYDNLIYHPNIQFGDLLNGIHFVGEYRNVNIYRNVIRYSSYNDCFGIKMDVDNGGNIKIKNNTLIRDGNV